MSDRREKSVYELMFYSETLNSIKVSKSDDDVHFYLPKSQIRISKRVKNMITVSVPLWLAEKEGLDPSLDGQGYEEGEPNVIEC